MSYIKRKLLSQNFLRNPELAKTLVEKSSIAKTDLVLEIGPGEGILTTALIQKSGHVIAVEIDSDCCSLLRSGFETVSNFTLYNQDFLSFSLPKVPYKVFANIPFSIEGQIVRKLIDAPNPPTDCYLVVIKSLAERLSGFQGNNQFSITHQPWFNFSIIRHFQRSDFTGNPNIDSVLWRIQKNLSPILLFKERDTFTKFVNLGFGHGLPLAKNLQTAHSKDRVFHFLTKYGYTKHTLPNALSLDAWLAAFKFFHV